MEPPLPLRVLYDARTVRPGMTGVGRYTYNLLAAMAADAEGPELRALFAREWAERARSDPNLRGVRILEAPVSHEAHPSGDLWLRFLAGRLVRRGEIYHGPAFVIPGGRQRFRRVVTVHDLFVFEYPEFYPARFAMWLRWAIRRACRFADRVIVPTRGVADALVRRGLAPNERVVPIAEAADATPATWEGDRPPGDLPLAQALSHRSGPIVLTVGTAEPRKDPATARRAAMALAAAGARVNWFWIGGPGAVADDTPPGLAEGAEAAGFQTVGAASGEAIRAALAEATVYVSSSRSEGFGLPVVEAMNAGCPVVLSDIPAHREVAGDAARYFGPGDDAALTRLLLKLMADDVERERLGERARARAARFGWLSAARATRGVYRALRRG